MKSHGGVNKKETVSMNKNTSGSATSWGRLWAYPGMKVLIASAIAGALIGTVVLLIKHGDTIVPGLIQKVSTP